MNLEKSLLSNSGKKKRIWEIDFLRGICILLMVFDHTLVTIAFSFNDAWLSIGGNGLTNFANFACNFVLEDESIRNAGGRLFVLVMLFGICGISSSFSRSNFKRGVQLFCCAMILTIGSYLGELWFGIEGIFVRFGVLHMLSLCIIIWAIICSVFKNPLGRSGIAIFLGVVLLVVEKLLLESNIAISNDSYLLIFSGSIAPDAGLFSPGDYFPLLPNISYFLIGAGLAHILYPKRKSLLPYLEGKWSKPIEFFGRHTLFIMMVHLVLIFLILMLVTFIMSGGVL